MNAQSCLAASDVATFQLQHLPMSLEAGPPREVKNLTLKKLQGALKKAGIHWLQEPEQMILLELLQQETWQISADFSRFQISVDSATLHPLSCY